LRRSQKVQASRRRDQLGQSRHLNGALGVSAIAPIATKMA